MCRINGILDTTNPSEREAILLRGRDRMAYGGPDDAGHYSDDHISLGHRRLAVIDLSAAGHQPMFWKEYVMVFNGEVYNYQEIREELEKLGHQFTSDSDSEVILKSFVQWGKDSVHRFRGMFAYAIWNKNTQHLTLCRDRVGVKPLYWYWKDGLFMFASELKAFHEHPQFDKTINHKAVSLFLQQGYIPSPECIFKYAHKLTPGSFLEINAQKDIQETCYWDAQQVFEKQTETIDDEEAALEELEQLLKDSFRLRMVADVPVGIFFSGGVDSSLVTTLLQKEASRPLNTFTIGFHEKANNEAVIAKEIAQHLGTNHTELYCKKEDFVDLIPQLSEWFDEPNGDTAALPTYMVSKLAREQVTVSLSADGGDELFGGYTKYLATQQVFPLLQKIPSFIKKGGHFIGKRIDPLTVQKYASVLPYLKNHTNLESKIPKLVNSLMADNLVDFFDLGTSLISPKQLRALCESEVANRFPQVSNQHPDRTLSYLGMIDIKTYLEGDIMAKVDRTTMQVALEGREPFLDHHLIEFSQRLSDNLKIKGGQTKYILRKLLSRHLPSELIDRPKQGFVIPLEKWLRSSLQNDLAAIPSDRQFVAAFRFNQAKLTQIINQFIEGGHATNTYFIWFLFVLHQWSKRWLY